MGRAEQESGADYYVAPRGASTDDLEEWIRFEVSGVNVGSDAAIRRRLKDKLDQLGRAADETPGIAGVVGFHARLIRFAPLDM